MQAQPRAGDDAERALAADEQLVRSGPTAARGAPPVWIDAAVGEHDVEADDHVLDLAVAGRVAGRRRGTRATRRPSTGRSTAASGPSVDAVLGAQRVLEPGAERAREDVEHERLAVDVDDAGEPAEVEHDAAVQRDARAAHAAAARGRGDRDARVVADAQHRGDLVGRRPAARPRRRAPRPARRAPRSSPAATSRGSPRDRRRRRRSTSAHADAQPARAPRRRRRPPGAERCAAHVGRGPAERRSVASAARSCPSRRLRSPSAVSGRSAASRSAATAARYSLTCRARSASSQPSSRPTSAATSSAAAAESSRASRRARVRRESTSSSVRAISWRTAYTASALRYGRPGHERLTERGVGVDERLDQRRLGAVAVGEMLVTARLVRRRAGPRSRRRRAAAGAWCGSGAACPSSASTASTVSAAIRRYVVSLPPVTVTTPPSERRTACRRERSAVRSLAAVRSSGRSPAHVPTRRPRGSAR